MTSDIPLASAIEFYLCGAFHRKNSAPSGGWWCDGVIGLSIVQLAPTAFQLIGAAYWAKTGHRSSPFYMAPFELELYFRSAGDLDAERVIVRFGSTDEFGQIECFDIDRYPGRIVQKRPTRDEDWAFAIELS